MSGNYILLLIFFILLLIGVDLSDESSIIKTWLKKKRKNGKSKS